MSTVNDICAVTATSMFVVVGGCIVLMLRKMTAAIPDREESQQIVNSVKDSISQVKLSVQGVERRVGETLTKVDDAAGQVKTSVQNIENRATHTLENINNTLANADKLLESLTSTTANLNNTLDTANKDLTDIAEILEKVNGQSENLADIINKVSRIANNVDQASQRLEGLLDRVDTASKKVVNASKDARKTLGKAKAGVAQLSQVCLWLNQAITDRSFADIAQTLLYAFSHRNTIPQGMDVPPILQTNSTSNTFEQFSDVSESD